MSEERKEHWLKIVAIIIATFIGAFLAFYLAVDISFNRMMSPTYQMKKMEKLMQKEEKRIQHLEKNMGENPFVEPKMGPTLVELVKEPDAYKIMVNLKPLDNNEKNVNVTVTDNVATVSGNVEKKEHHREDIMSFSQSYYLDDNIQADKMTKERKGDKYIITIPYEED